MGWFIKTEKKPDVLTVLESKPVEVQMETPAPKKKIAFKVPERKKLLRSLKASSDEKLITYAKNGNLVDYITHYLKANSDGKTLIDIVKQLIEDGVQIKSFAGQLAPKCSDIVQTLVKDGVIVTNGFRDQIPVYCYKAIVGVGLNG